MSKFTAKLLLFGGIAFMIGGSLIAYLGNRYGMMSATERLGSSGIGDPTGLSSDIGFILVLSAVGLAIGLIGVIAILIGIAFWVVVMRRARTQNTQNKAEQDAAANP